MVHAQRVVFTQPGAVEHQAFDVEQPGQGEVLVETEYTLMSTGTENTVLNRRFAPGTHWDNWVKFPFYPGYCAIGRVVAAGEGANLAVGQRVAMRAGHASHHRLKEATLTPVPAGLDPSLATWFALAKIAFQGARRAEFRIGDEVLIIGAGPIGQMILRWAVAAGAGRVSVVDPAAARLPFATAGGATCVIAGAVDTALEAVKAHHGGELPRVVIDTTGNPAVFIQALAAVRRFGRVVLLGDAGSPGDQRLSPDLITKGLTVVGAHDIHDDAEWNERTIGDLFFRLVAAGRFPLAGLNTDIYAAEACASAYVAANQRRADMLGVVFAWPGAVATATATAA